LQRGQSLLTISLRRVTSNVLQHPWIKQVSLSRRLPHTLAIRVEEREETAWMTAPSGDGCLTVAEGGVVVSEVCEHADALIELRGARVSGGIGGSLLDLPIVQMIDALRSDGLASLGSRWIDVADPESVAVGTASGLRILLGNLSEAPSRLDALAVLYRSLDLEDYEVVDLRFGGEATLVPR
jgi:cell division septal protein FtsQ